MIEKERKRYYLVKAPAATDVFCLLSDIQTKLNNDVHGNGQHTDAVYIGQNLQQPSEGQYF